MLKACLKASGILYLREAVVGAWRSGHQAWCRCPVDCGQGVAVTGDWALKTSCPSFLCSSMWTCPDVSVMIDRALENNHLSFVCSSVWTCLDIAVMVDQALKTSYLSFVRTILKVKEVTLCFET